MTVKELRTKLEEFPDDMEVLFEDYEQGPTDIVEIQLAYLWRNDHQPFVILRG